MKMDLDIDALVATGPAGVRTILTAFNDFIPDTDNLTVNARFPSRLLAEPASMGCFVWSQTIPNANVIGTKYGSLIIPSSKLVGKISLSSLIISAHNSYTAPNNVIVAIYVNDVATALVFGPAALTIATPANDIVHGVTAGSPGIPVFPGDEISLRFDTTTNPTLSCTVQLYYIVHHHTGGF